MGIEAVWRDENRNELGRVGDPHMVLSRVAEGSLDLDGTVCLQFLDAYGDACFNQFQIPILAGELAAAAERCPDMETREHLFAVADLAKRAQGIHTYLWFIGD